MRARNHPTGKVALLIRVTPQMHRQIKAAARERGQSMSDYVKASIRRELGEESAGARVARMLRSSHS